MAALPFPIQQPRGRRLSNDQTSNLHEKNQLKTEESSNRRIKILNTRLGTRLSLVMSTPTSSRFLQKEQNFTFPTHSKGEFL